MVFGPASTVRIAKTPGTRRPFLSGRNWLPSRDLAIPPAQGRLDLLLRTVPCRRRANCTLGAAVLGDRQHDFHVAVGVGPDADLQRMLLGRSSRRAPVTEPPVTENAWSLRIL